MLLPLGEALEASDLQGTLLTWFLSSEFNPILTLSLREYSLGMTVTVNVLILYFIPK